MDVPRPGPDVDESGPRTVPSPPGTAPATGVRPGACLACAGTVESADGRRPVVATRRAVLAGSGASAALLLLAACGGEPPSGTRGGGADEDADDDADDDREDGDQDDDGGGGRLVGPGEALASTSDVPVGGALAVTVGGAQLLVTQPEEGTFAAFSAICTHEGCTVGPGDGELLCPCHASRYDLATGAVLGGPAPAPLPEVPVTVDGGEVTSA